jgi:putative RNA 2'-phosphotransferase
MADKEITQASKVLALILRHEPGRVGLKLGEAGWVNVQKLLKAVNGHGSALSLEQLKEIGATSDKRIRVQRGWPAH